MDSSSEATGPTPPNQPQSNEEHVGGSSNTDTANPEPTQTITAEVPTSTDPDSPTAPSSNPGHSGAAGTQPELVAGMASSGARSAINKKFSRMMAKFESDDVDADVAAMARELLQERRLRHKRWSGWLSGNVGPGADGHHAGGKYYRAGCELVLSFDPALETEPVDAFKHAEEAYRLYQKIMNKHPQYVDKEEMWITITYYRNIAAQRVEALKALFPASAADFFTGTRTSAQASGAITEPDTVQNSGSVQSAPAQEKKGLLRKAVDSCTHLAWANALDKR